MNITSINLLPNNFAGKIINRTPLYDKDTNIKYRDFSLAIDTASFNIPRHIKKEEKISDILKDTKINGKFRRHVLRPLRR